MRDMDTPRVFSPGIFSTLAPVTREPMVLLVAPGVASPLKKKSASVTFAAGLQANPFSLTPARSGQFAGERTASDLRIIDLLPEPGSATQMSCSMSGSAARQGGTTRREKKASSNSEGLVMAVSISIDVAVLGLGGRLDF